MKGSLKRLNKYIGTAILFYFQQSKSEQGSTHLLGWLPTRLRCGDSDSAKLLLAKPALHIRGHLIHSRVYYSETRGEGARGLGAAAALLAIG